jgi:hypothetical protein
LQLGNGKFFIGDGYRSLLLSDNSFSYPYLKIAFESAKWQYIALFTEFQNFKGAYYNYHFKKHATFTYLNWTPIPNLNVSLFEAIIWKTTDSTYSKKFKSDFFKPVIFLRLAKYNLNESDNFLYGINLRYDFLKNLEFYNQYMIDDLDVSTFFSANHHFRNKFGFQFGLKCYDVFFHNFKNHKLYIQAELNQVQPYTYSHLLPLQNYSHMNQPLAHPLGAGFREFIAMANYCFGNISFQIQYNHAISSADTVNSNFGSDIFISDSETMLINSRSSGIGEGNKTTISHKIFKLSYLINPHINLKLLVGIQFRTYKNELNELRTNYIFIGLRTCLTNIYYDF